MESSRDENMKTKELPFGFPEEIFFKILFPFVDPNKDCFSIDNTRALARLSGICPSMYRFFKPELDKRLNRFTLLALTCVLQGNEEVAIKLAESHPKIFFIKGTSCDYAVDLEGNRRILEDWSPYQAMFGTGDFEMLKKVKPYLNAYLSTLSNGNKLACHQEQEKFPNGFDYPESTYEFGHLVQAITTDLQLIDTGKPSDTTLSALAAFKTDFKPGLIKTGHHFNLNDFVKALAVYDKNLKRWNEHQMWFFGVYIIGFLERLLPAPYMQRACQGFNNEQPLNRIYNILNRLYNLETAKLEQDTQIIVFPLDTDVACRLGDSFFISSHNGIGLNYWPNPGAFYYKKNPLSGSWKSYVKQVENHFKTFSQELSDITTKANKNNSLTFTRNIQDGINFRTLGLFSIGAVFAGIALVSGIKKFNSYRK